MHTWSYGTFSSMAMQLSLFFFFFHKLSVVECSLPGAYRSTSYASRRNWHFLQSSFVLSWILCVNAQVTWMEAFGAAWYATVTGSNHFLYSCWCMRVRYDDIVFRLCSESDFIEAVLKSLFECVGGKCMEAVMHTRLITSSLRLLGRHFFFFHSQISLCTDSYVNKQST